MNRLRVWIPLALFVLFVGVAAYQLSQPRDDMVASRFIGQPLPQFDLKAASADRPGVKTADFADGQPRLLNIWASWCVPCAAEAPQLEQLRQAGAQIVGVAVRDQPEDVARFLAQYGNPYSQLGADNLSEVQLGIGSSGVPETFVIDGKGIVRYQHIGDIRSENVPMLLQKLKEAGQ